MITAVSAVTVRRPSPVATSTVRGPRNAARPARTVDMAVVRRQLAEVRTALDGPLPILHGEGFRQIVVLRDPAEVDQVTIRRRPKG